MYALGANVCGAPSETITIDEALQRIQERTRAISGREVVPLCQAQGRILATNMKFLIDVPAHDSSAMDGYALHAADLFPKGETVMRVRGRAAAGRPLSRAVARGEAARIFTGAPMPAGADTVVIQENCCREGASVRILSSTKPGANVRRAGEDVSAGALALASGRQLGPEHLALAAAVGHRALCVTKRL
jgi:molybdopterin molybdotransferase